MSIAIVGARIALHLIFGDLAAPVAVFALWLVVRHNVRPLIAPVFAVAV